MKGSNGNESMALRVGRGLGRMAAPVVAMEARFWGLLAKVGAPLPLLNLLKRIARLAAVAVLAMASAQYLFPVLVFLFALYAVCALSSSSNERAMERAGKSSSGDNELISNGCYSVDSDNGGVVGLRNGKQGYGYYNVFGERDLGKWSE